MEKVMLTPKEQVVELINDYGNSYLAKMIADKVLAECQEALRRKDIPEEEVEILRQKEAYWQEVRKEIVSEKS